MNNINKLYIYPLLVSVLLLNACATHPLTKEECQNLDVEKKGFNDGNMGFPPEFERVDKACKAQGVELSAAKYFEGWRSGMIMHCGLSNC